MARFRMRSALSLGAAVVVAVGVVVLAQGPGGLTGLFVAVGPQERADQVLAGLAAEAPYVALMRERRPEAYAAVRERLAEAATNGHTVMQMADQGRRFMAQWLADAISAAPDAVALEMLAVTQAQFRELLVASPELCAAMARGESFDEARAGAYLSSELLAREAAAYERLLTTPAGAAVVSLPEAEVDAAYALINPELQSRFGADLALMEAETVAGADLVKVCAIQVATLEAFAGLGPERAAAVARAVLGGS